MQLLEESHFSNSSAPLVGIDEAGRGCLFGAVTVAAVWLSPDSWHHVQSQSWFSQVRDSKKISPPLREKLFFQIRNCFPFSISHISVGFIEKYNINRAVQYGLYRCLFSLERRGDISPRHSRNVMDGNYNFQFPQLRMSRPFFSVEYIPRADSLSFAVAAASILAKVSRDHLMHKAHFRFPKYNLQQHKGYGTLAHRESILQHGISSLHRRSFLKKIIREEQI